MKDVCQHSLMSSDRERESIRTTKDIETSIVKAYGEGDTHLEETSGYRDIEAFPNKERLCDMCSMVARNDEELRSHIRSAHAS